MSFRLQKLGKLGGFRNGLNYSKANFGHGLKVINVKDFGDRWRPELAGLDEIDPAGVPAARCDLRRGDILFVRSNGNRDLVGRSMLIEDDLEDVAFSGFCIRFRPTEADGESRFLSLYFRTPKFRRTLSLQGKGTNINNLNQGILEQMDVPWPERVVRERIVDIAGTYDDLVENNRRRIALLEASALLLYREWFVQFRFPGHEQSKFSDDLPDGWARLPASEAFQVNPKTSRNDDGTIVYFPMASLSKVGMVIDRGGLEHREKPTSVRFRNSDTLFARITPSLENGKTAFVQLLGPDEVASGSTEFIVLRGRHVSDYFVYLTARQPDFRENAIKSMIGSSGRQRVQPSCFDRYLVPVPPKLIAELFVEVVEPMFDQINRLDRQNQALAQARDLLLPRLMNGEITV